MSFCNERAFPCSPACVARKMRCLRLRTIRWALRQSMASQSVRLSGPFASPGDSHPTCPSICSLRRALRVAHPTHVSRLSASGHEPYPPGYGFPSPFGRWPSLLGSSFPAEELCPPCVGPTGGAGPHRGFHVPHRRECDRGGCPLYRGSQVSFGPRVSGGDPAEPPSPSAPAPSSPRQPLRRPMYHAASSRVHSRSPVRSPLGLTPPSAGSSLGRYHPIQTTSLPTGSGMVRGGPRTQAQRHKSRSP